MRGFRLFGEGPGALWGGGTRREKPGGEPGGETVAAEEVGGGTVEVSVRELPRGWELSVADPGRPLPADLREKAFVPFTPQRARGSGLGLAVVARIAVEHGGSARIEERPAGGNVICLTFGA